MRKVDLTGKTFGRLTVMWPAGYSGVNRKIMWMCSCHDGNFVAVSRANLQSGHTISCGCLNKEATRQALTQHGMTKSPEWLSFVHAKQRCTNKNNGKYKYYGGRGIEFRFKSFREFYNDIGKKPAEKHSLDRINNDGHYEVGNVRWATHSEQMKNRSKRKKQ